jgi:hypothetical protein
MDAAMQMGIEAARQMSGSTGEKRAARLDAARLDEIGRAKGVVETRAITA